MPAEEELTRGAVALISDSRAGDLRPVLQVYDLRLVNPPDKKNPARDSPPPRYRMVLSDGEFSQQAMLATQQNALVTSGALKLGSFVRLNVYNSSVIRDRRIIIVVNLEVVCSERGIIGRPEIYGSPGLPNDPSTSIQALDDNRASNNASAPYGAPRSRDTSNVSTNQNQRSAVADSGWVNRPPDTTRRPAAQLSNQPPSMYVNRGPISRNEAPARFIPIAALNPYQGRWTIKARVTSKSELRKYNNPRGEGKVFSFDLLDADGGEIRATCFNAVADQFFDKIEPGSVYLISRGTLKPAQRNFNPLNNEYEITLDSFSAIDSSLDDGTIPMQQFNFKKISEVEGLENNAMIDLIGIVTSVSPATTIMRKNGTEVLKRTLQLKDMSGYSVEVTLWGNFCSVDGQKIQNMCDAGVFPVLAIKAGRVSEFNGKSVGTISSSQLLVDPDFLESKELKEWYNGAGKDVYCPSISREVSKLARADARKTVSQIKDENLGLSEKPDFITIKASISFIKTDNFCYTSCPLKVGDRLCCKKVNNNGDGSWHCERCDQSFPECDYRYLLTLQIQDHTGLTYVTAFEECGQQILGITAKELYLLKNEEQDDAKFGDILQGIRHRQFLFKLKVQEQMFNDEQRVKCVALQAEKIDPLSESRNLLNAIEKLLLEESSTTSQMGVNPNPLGENTDVGLKPTSLASDHNGGIGVTSRSYSSPTVKMEPGNGHMVTGNHISGGMELPASRSYTAQNYPSNSAGGFTTGPSSNSFGKPASSAGDVCYKCQQPGHWGRDCHLSGTGAPGYVNPTTSVRYGKQFVG